MGNNKLDIPLEIMIKIIKEVTKKAIAEINANQEIKRDLPATTINRNKGFTMFMPVEPISKKIESHHQEISNAYRNNNSGSYELDKKVPKHPPSEAIATYKYYESKNALLKKCAEEREKREKHRASLRK